MTRTETNTEGIAKKKLIQIVGDTGYGLGDLQCWWDGEEAVQALLNYVGRAHIDLEASRAERDFDPDRIWEIASEGRRPYENQQGIYRLILGDALWPGEASWTEEGWTEGVSSTGAWARSRGKWFVSADPDGLCLYRESPDGGREQVAGDGYV